MLANPDDLYVVPDWDAAQTVVRSGVDSRFVVVLNGGDEAGARATAEAGLVAGRGPLPTAPFDSGMRCLVVIPTYNERDNIERMLEDVLAYLQTDVLVVDDGSPDGTGLVVDGLASRDPRIHVLHRKGKLGLGSAYIAGFRFAMEHGYDRVFEMDADFSHPPWDLPRLAHAARDADLVIGSRYVQGGSTVGWDFRRRLLSRGANLYARMCLRTGVRDMTGGFRCFRVDRLAAIDLGSVQAEGYAFQIEMAYRFRRNRYRVVEVPIHFEDRRVGQSKMDGAIAREALLLVPRLPFKVRRDNR